MDTELRSEKEQLRVHIRWMIRRDMPEVLQTEQASFDYSWTEEDFLRCLRQRDCIGMVAELGEKVVGFMIYELHKAKLHILNFAVHPSFRRQGIGFQMVAKLISKLSSHRRTEITLELREKNLAAQLFFRNQIFLSQRVLKNYYEDTGEDAFLMRYQLFDDARLRKLAMRFPALTITTLYLRESSVTDAGLKDLPRYFPRLTKLYLGRTYVTNAGLKELGRNYLSLSTLDLSNTKVTDAGLRELGGNFPSLTTLDLSNTKVTDAGLKYLVQSFPVLTKLSLSGLLVTDAGLKDLTQYFPVLTMLDVSCTAVSRFGRNELQRVYPKCKIY